MKFNKQIKKNGYSILSKSIRMDNEISMYFRQYYNGEPIHDWKKYSLDDNGFIEYSAADHDILKNIFGEFKTNIISFGNIKCPF